MPGNVSGVNAFRSLTVPAADGFGAPVVINDLVAWKTLFLSGIIDGEYVVYGTHDGVRFAPIAIFQAKNANVRESREVYGTYQQLMVFRRAFGASPVMNVSSKSTCAC
jgi:hypothetical protein